MSKRPRPPPPALFASPALLFGLSDAKAAIFQHNFVCASLARGRSVKDVSARREQLLLCPAGTTLVVLASQSRETTASALGVSLDELLTLLEDRGLRVVTQAWVSNCLALLRDGGVTVDVVLTTAPPDGFVERAPSAASAPPSRALGGGASDVGAASDLGLQRRPPAQPPLPPQRPQETVAVAAPSPLSPSASSARGGPLAPLLEASAWRQRAAAAAARLGTVLPHPGCRFAKTALVHRDCGCLKIVVPELAELQQLLIAAGCAGSDLIRLLTFNARSFRKLRDKSPSGLARLLDAADIFAIQETQLTNADTKDCIRSLMQRYHSECKTLGMPSEVTDFEVFSNGKCGLRAQETGVAVLVRRRWAAGARVERLDLPIPDLPAPALPAAAAASASAPLAAEATTRAITVHVPAAGLTVVCVHRPYVAKGQAVTERRKAAYRAWPNALVSHVQQLRAVRGALPVTVMGDLNAPPGEALDHHVWAKLAPLGLLDATAGTTEFAERSQFPEGGYPFTRLDYVLLDRALQERLVRCSGRVLSVGAPAGDHVPVFAALRAPPARDARDGPALQAR